MRRIHDNNMTYTHPEANHWLTEFMIDLKQMAAGENYQPFTMERLNEWSKHRSDYETCADFESSFMKRLHDPLISEHAEAMFCFNGIVIDLKLMVMGHEYDAITAERIKEADKHYMDVTRCRKSPRIYR